MDKDNLRDHKSREDIEVFLPFLEKWFDASVIYYKFK